MPFQVPQDLIFLLRTAAILSGMCTGLDPGFNFWNVLRPYGEQLMGEETRSLAWLKEAVAILQTLLSLPKQAEALINRLNRGKLQVQAPAVERGIRQINQTLKNLVYAVIFFAFLSSGVQLYFRQPDWLAFAFLGFAGLFLMAAVWPRHRNR
jgi:predicted unusual protein kinase regulating ubiquinone biosynthesis (AarF/ABC1/UbiB family)